MQQVNKNKNVLKQWIVLLCMIIKKNSKMIISLQFVANVMSVYDYITINHYILYTSKYIMLLDALLSV
jgi:hypothetical protein